MQQIIVKSMEKIMLSFLLILILVLLLMALLAIFSLRYLFSGRRLKHARFSILVFDVGCVLLLFTCGMKEARVTESVAVVFMAELFFSLFAFMAVLARWLYRKAMRVPYDPERRRLLKKAAVYPAAAMGLSLYGAEVERLHQVERRFRIPVAGLKDEAVMTLAQLSDIHLGNFFSLSMLDALIVQTAASAPDLLVITGDLFDDVDKNAQAAEILEQHVDDFPLGIAFILGNHEYLRDAPRTLSYLAKTRVRVLLDDAVEIAGGLYLAGAGYPVDRAHFDEMRRAHAEKAMAKVPVGAPFILLGHHPEFIDDGAAHGAALTLTGHTHGSQFGILGLPLFPVFKYTRGMVKVGDSTGYVHSGNGSWFPLRIGCPPEIAFFRLEPKKS